MKSSEELKKKLLSINHKSYPLYKELKGSYDFLEYRLNIDHVQGDPFAAPSKISIQVKGSGFPKENYDSYPKRIALQDAVLRLFSDKIRKYHKKAKGSGKSGCMTVSSCGQEILERTACELNPVNGDLQIRLEIGFPANGRTINSLELIKILYDFLPVCIKETCFFARYQESLKLMVRKVRELAEDQQFIREQLGRMGLVAFVANDSILPRESGVSDRPMNHSVKFQSPKSMEVTMMLPNFGEKKGMGIPKGITLIVGGGYHGKSTLLKALELGVYNHIAGDGREYVITDDSGMKIRAEDGRSIKNTNISLFINNLPDHRDTVKFCTDDASGSTSQAANVMEAWEAGTRLLLIDEDTSATNFMIRDELMQLVVGRNQEPITPFIERIREIYDSWSVSTILVAGSSGAYFHVADHIIQMDSYIPEDITQKAKKEAQAYPLSIPSHLVLSEGLKSERVLLPAGDRSGQDRLKIKSLGKDGLMLGYEEIQLRYLEQIVDEEQVISLGYLLKYAMENMVDGSRDFVEILDKLEREINCHGLSRITGNGYPLPNMARPRRQEISACINRYRNLKIR